MRCRHYTLPIAHRLLLWRLRGEPFRGGVHASADPFERTGSVERTKELTVAGRDGIGVGEESVAVEEPLRSLREFVHPTI